MKTIDDLKSIIREKDKLINHTNIYAHRSVSITQRLNSTRKSRLGTLKQIIHFVTRKHKFSIDITFTWDIPQNQIPFPFLL